MPGLQIEDRPGLP